jgi:precorrin-4/cobalt-precorrin-4 C11-methyltransferase
VAHRVSQRDELILRGTLADIADAVEEANLRQAAVILVGPALADPAGAESFLYSAGRDRRAKTFRKPPGD